MSLGATKVEDFTFLRTGVASYLAEDLMVASKATDEPRDEAFFDIGTKGWLLEPGRTNSFTRSEEFDHADWTKTNSSITADAATAPSDQSSADEIVEDATASAQHGVQRNLPTLADDTDQPVSFFVQANSRTWCYIQTVDKAGVTRRTWFNLSTGAAGTTDAGHTARIRAAKNGFYRISVIFDSANGGGTPSAGLFLASADNTATYSGDGSSSIYAWGGQFETDGLFPTAYIMTAAATASRGAEQAFTNFTILPQGMTIYLRFVELGTLIGSGRVLHIGDAASDAQSIKIHSNGTDYRIVHTNGSSVTSNAGSPSLEDTVELRAVLFGTGAVQLHANINDAGESSGSKSAALALPSAWGAEQVFLNARETLEPGCAIYSAAKIAYGVQSLDYMRKFGRLL